MIIASFPKRRHYTFPWLLASSAQLASAPCDPTISDAESTMWNFWKTFYRVDESNTLNSLLPPRSLLEFYDRDVELNMKQKSFLFAATIGVGASLLASVPKSKSKAVRLIIPPSNRELPFDQETLDYLSAWHFLHLCDTVKPPCKVNHLVRCLTTRDRQQYLREANNLASVEVLEFSRWYYLDAATEATVLPVKELLTTILVDMSMLLNLVQVPCPTDDPTLVDQIAKILVPSLALIILGSIGEYNVRLGYFFVQQAFQMIRCAHFGFHHQDTTLENAMNVLIQATPPEMAFGFRRFLSCWAPQFAIPDNLRFEDSGVWPLLVNPFKMHGMARSGAPVSKGALFKLHPSLCTWEIDTVTASMAHNNHLASLEAYISNAYRELPLPPKNHSPCRTYASMGETSPLPKRCLRTLWSWITTRPYQGTNLLAAVPWVPEDPWMVGIRSRMAIAVTASLIPGGLPYLSRHAKIIQRYHDKLVRIKGTMVLLALVLPTCFCSHSTDEENSLLSDIPNFAVPSNCRQSRFRDEQEQGYDDEEISDKPLSTPSVSPCIMRLRRILESRQDDIRCSKVVGLGKVVSLHPPQKPQKRGIPNPQTKHKTSRRKHIDPSPTMRPKTSKAPKTLEAPKTSEVPETSEAPKTSEAPTILSMDVHPITPCVSGAVLFHDEGTVPIGTVSVRPRD